MLTQLILHTRKRREEEAIAAIMAQSLKARFEKLAADQLKDPSVEEREVVVEQEIEDPKLGWQHSGNSGGTCLMQGGL